MQESMPVKLPVLANRKLKSFPVSDDLKAFIIDEDKAWSFLTDNTQHRSNSGEDKIIRLIFSHLYAPIRTSLAAICSSWGNLQATSIEEFAELQDQVDFPFSKTTKGKAILNLKEDDLTKAVVLSLMCMPPHDSTLKVIQNFKKLWEKEPRQPMSNIENHYASIGLVILKAQSILLSIEQGLHKSQHVKILDGITEAYEQIDLKKDKLEADMNNLFQEAESNYKVANERVSGFLGRRLRAYKKRHSLAQKQIIAAKETYYSEVELHASVKYWDDKRKSHSKSKNLWGGILFASLIGTFWAFREVLINHELTPKFATSTSAIAAETVKSIEPITQNPYLIGGVINPLTVSLGIVALSIGSYIIKLTSQQFRTHQHLMLEAIERHTMLKTYLALMSEDKLKDAEDRKAALDVLFRPASTGMIQEQASVMPTDSIIKVIRSKPSS